MADLRKLKDEALAAAANANWKKAASLYATLEQHERDGLWPLKLGECLRKLGHRAEAIKALSRAVDIYAKSDLLLKAIAVCRDHPRDRSQPHQDPAGAGRLPCFTRRRPAWCSGCGARSSGRPAACDAGLGPGHACSRWGHGGSTSRAPVGRCRGSVASAALSAGGRFACERAPRRSAAGAHPGGHVARGAAV